MEEEVMMEEETIEEEVIVVQNEEEIIQAEEHSAQITHDQPVQDVIDADDVYILDIEAEEAFPASGGDNSTLNHALLYGREAANQHPITAIEGLRQELDAIESLRTIYSDKTQQADYYMWRQDEAHPLPSHPHGLFVSIYPGTNKIQICNETSDVFGVTVAEAAFVGNQEYVQAEGGTQTGRDGNYGLVVCSGLVAVRRESTVVVGDYVVPNSRGEAKKSSGKYGYLVTALSEVNGVSYAHISLGSPSTLAKSCADSVQDLIVRTRNNEYNITSVANVANSAYAMAIDAKENAEVNSEYLEEAIEEVLGRMDAQDGIIGNLSESVTIANTTAEMARTIAEGAVSSADAMRSEAVEKVNEVLQDIQQVRQDFTTTKEEVKQVADGAALDAKQAIDAINTIAEDIEPLSQWKSDDGAQTGISGFVSKSNSESTELAQISKWKSDVSPDVDSIAAIKTTAEENKAALDALTKYEYEDEDGNTHTGLAGLQAQVDANTSKLSTLSDYEHKDEHGNVVSSGIAGLIAQVDDNSSELETLAKFEQGGNTGVAGLIAQVNADASELSNIASHTYTDDKGNELSGLAAINQQVTDQGSDITQLTDWQGKTDDSVAKLQTRADENGAKIEALVANVGKYAVGEYSQAHGLSHDEAKSILKDGYIYVPTVKYDGNYIKDATEFLVGCYYRWNGTHWVASASSAVSFLSAYLNGSEATPYWVVTTADVVNNNVTYDLGGLYSWENNAWVKVASVADNIFSRAVSAIKQTTNSISADITSVKDDYVALDLRVGANATSLQTVTSWQDEATKKMATIEQQASDNASSIALVVTETDGERTLNTTSITAAIAEDESFIGIIADNINLDGYVTFDNLKETDGTTEISGSNITTGTIDASQVTVTNLNANNITSGTIDASQVTVINLNADNIESGTIDAGVITVTNLNASNITSGTIDAGLIAADTLEAITGTMGDLTAGTITSSDYEIGDTGKRDLAVWGGESVPWNYGEFAMSPQLSGSSEGLKYELSADGESYVVSGYDSTVKITCVAIPSEYNERPVRSIGQAAFRNCSTLTRIIIPDSVKTIGSYAFTSCYSLTNIVIPNSVSIIWDHTFSSCISLTSVVIGDSVVSIGKAAFSGCTSLTRIMIPESVVEIGELAFNSTNLIAVYYNGSTTSWETLEKKIGAYNNKLVEATRYYYSETQPTTEGNYWHITSGIGTISGFKFSCDDNYPMIDSPYFQVTRTGTVTANNGLIGPFTLDTNGLSLYQNNQVLSLSTTGIRLTGDPFAFSIGNLNIQHSTDTGTILSTSSKLSLQGDNNTKISLMSDGQSTSTTFKVTANFRTYPYFGGFGSDGVTFRCFGLDEAPYYSFEVSLWYEFSNGDSGVISTVYSPENYGYRELQVGKTDGIARYGKFRYKTRTSDWSEWYNAKAIQDNDTGWDGSVIHETTQTKTNDNIIIQGHLVPNDAQYNLGESGSRKWNYLFLLNSGNGSDRKIKDNIRDMDTAFSEKLICGLHPKSYIFKTAKTPRIHYGFIAQEVEELLNSLGTSVDEVGIVCKSLPGEPDSENNFYSLNYTNLIAPMVSVIQELKMKVDTLETELNTLKTQQND